MISDANTMQIRLDGRYLLFPINSDAPERKVRLALEPGPVRSFAASIGLPAQWWAHMDVGEFAGASVLVEMEPADADAQAAIHSSESVWTSESLYLEPERPWFHFTPRRGWTNDPNGLVWHAGVYHLFFQHNPYASTWGNMHWGHATSPDLIHWHEEPIALYPNGDDDMAFSGSAVVDTKKTSGWEGADPPIVIAFTSTGRGECIVFPSADGRSWTEYSGNPVVRHRGRDPRLLWHVESKRWVMAVYDELETNDDSQAQVGGIAFYTSDDLKSWTFQSRISGFFECPDIFALAVDDDPADVRWVLTHAPGDYYIGSFDGATFNPTTDRLPAPSGEPGLFYAAQTFSNHPTGECIQMAWGLIESKDPSFNQLQLGPFRLTLRTTVEGLRLCREPIDALKSLRSESIEIAARSLGDSKLLADLDGTAWDIETTLRPWPGASIRLEIGSDVFTYHSPSQMMVGPRGSIHVPMVDDMVGMRILVDKSTIEVFGDKGQAYGVFSRSLPRDRCPLRLMKAEWSPDCDIVRLVVHRLNSSWNTSATV